MKSSPSIDNLLTKGMHSDNPEELQPQGTYRDSLNGDLIHFGGDNWEWKPMLGTTTSFTMCSGFSPIGGCVLRNKIIVFSIKSTLGQIGQVLMNNDGTGTYTPLMTSALLYFAHNHPIEKECYGIYENALLQRIYWTDNYNSPRSLNIALTVQKTTGLILPGILYNVTCGTIVYNAITYNEGDNFTGVGVTTFTGTGIVCTTVPVASLDFYPKNSLADFSVERPIVGTVPGGVYYFAWKLDDINGASSEWSYLAGPVPVYNDLMNTGTVIEYQNTLGAAFDINTKVGIRIKLDNLNTAYTSIKVAAFHSTDKDIFENGVIFVNKAYSTSSETFDFTEYVGDALLLSEVMLQGITIEKCKSITHDKYIGVIGNVSEESELNETWDPSNATITEARYELPAIGWDTEVGHINYALTGPTMCGVTPKTNIVPDANWQLIWVTSTYVDANCKGWLYPNFWYKVTGAVGLTFEHPVTTTEGVGRIGQTYTIPASGEIWIQGFMGSDLAPSRPVGVWLPTGGSVHTDFIFTPYIRKKTYYDNVLIAQQYKNIPINDDWLDYKGMIVNSELKSYWGGETYRFACIGMKRGKPKYARFLKDVVFDKRDNSSLVNQLIKSYDTYTTASGTYSHFHNLQASGILIDNLDLTKIINDIDGFMIVRCQRDAQYLNEGWASCVRDNGTYSGDPYYVAARGLYSDPLTAVPKRQLYYSPDLILDNRTFIHQVGDEFEVLRALQDEAEFSISDGDPGMDYFGHEEKHVLRATGGGNTFTRYSLFANPVSSLLPEGTKDTLDDYNWANWGANLVTLFAGEYFSNLILTPRGAFGCEALYLKQKTYNALGHASDNKIDFISQKRTKTNLYGGISLDAKANNEYIFCGHYQRVDAAFIASIKSGSDYVVNGLEVFGGDTFVTIYDFERMYKDNGAAFNLSHSMFFPIQSNSNTSLRIGPNTVSSKGTYSSGVGIVNYQAVIGTHLEDLDENKAYSTDYTGRGYPALPYPYSFGNSFDAMIRWSAKKVLGENIDAYRYFPPLQFKHLETRSGPIYNVRGLGGRIFYWQDSGVGYLPISERIMQSGTGNVPVQMGIGGEMDRFDEIHHAIGNQHSNGLVPYEGGFAWIDFKRRMILRMTTSFGKEEIQLVKGVQYFIDSLNDLIGSGEAVSHNTYPVGIIGINDPHRKRIYFSCVYYVKGDTVEIFNSTFSIDQVQNAFNGRYSFRPIFGIDYYKYMITAKYGNLGYLHYNGVQCEFYGTAYEAFVDIVVNPNMKEPKVFNNHLCFGNSNRFFDEITYMTKNQTSVDTIYDASGNKVNRNYEYRNDKWQWSTALSTTGRMRGLYMKIRLKILSTTKTVVSLIGITTEFNQTK